MELPSTIEALFERDYDRLVRSLGVAFDPEAAADAVQEAFIAADRRWTKVSRLNDPAGWIRHVALNRLVSGRRLGRRRREILGTIRLVSSDDLTDDLLDLRRSMDALPDRQRITVCLFHLGGYTIQEVASALGVSSGTVKSNLHDARRRLRADMGEHQHD